MAEEEDKKTLVVKTAAKSGVGAVALYAAIGVGGYLLYKYLENKDIDIGIPDPGNIAAGVTETIKETTTTIIKEVTSWGDLPEDRALSDAEEAAITGREEPGKPWSLSKETTSQIRKAPKSAGAWTENLIKAITTADPAKKGPTRGVPTGVLSEYTPEEMKRTVFKDKSYKGPSLFGWLTRPAQAITGTGLNQTGVYVPGVGIAQNVTLSGEGRSTTKADTTARRKTGSSKIYTSSEPSPKKPMSGEEKLSRFKADIAAGRSPITGEKIKTKKKEKDKERKTGGDIHGRKPGVK